MSPARKLFNPLGSWSRILGPCYVGLEIPGNPLVAFGSTGWLDDCHMIRYDS